MVAFSLAEMYAACDFLRAQVPSLLISIYDRVRRLKLALPTTSDTRTGTFNALVDPIPPYAEHVQLQSTGSSGQYHFWTSLQSRRSFSIVDRGSIMSIMNLS